MKEAAADEDFTRAQRRKDEIQNLKTELLGELERAMRKAADDEDFNKAQHLKDQIQMLQASSSQEVTTCSSKEANCRHTNCCRDDGFTCRATSKWWSSCLPAHSPHQQQEATNNAKWTWEDGLPTNEGSDYATIDKSGIDTLEQMKAACESHHECVGFAYRPATRDWYPKRAGTGFFKDTATYSQWRAPETWQWHYIPLRAPAIDQHRSKQSAWNNVGRSSAA